MPEHDLRACQRESLALLVEFRRVCEALDLRYYLTAGTLLGAVRHGGFIPWDDDVDVAMPREDYDRLSREAADLLGPEHFYQDYRSEPNFPYYFSKLRRRGTAVDEPILRAVSMEQGYYIDVFPLDPCPDDPARARRFFKAIEVIDCAVLARVSSEFVCGYEKPAARLIWRLLSSLPNKALFALREGQRKKAAKAASGEVLCTVGGHHGYPRESYRREWFASAEEMEFEGERFPVPAGWRELLTNMYGDYMTPPPESERQGHFEET